MEVDPTGRAKRITRMKKAYAELGIDKEKWMATTGYSEKQWYSWHSVDGNSPHIDHVVKCFWRLDINPAYVWFGIGPIRLSEVEPDQAMKEKINEIYRVVMKL